MGYQFQCSLTAQDCATLYPNRNGTTGPSKLAFTNKSCVRDARLDGNVGRCGFPGAPCVLQQANGMDNCAGGGDSAYKGYKQICIPDSPGSSTGICRGAAGDVCTGSIECNWGMSCNNTYSQGIFTAGVCGGSNAYMNNNEAADNLDFGRDYCLSGEAHQDPTTDYWLCSEGPPMALTVAPSPVPSPEPSPGPAKKKINVGVIAGPVAAVLVVGVFAGVYFFLLRRRRSRSRKDLRPDTVLKKHIDIEEKFQKRVTHEDKRSAGAGGVRPHAQDGADRHAVTVGSRRGASVGRGQRQGQSPRLGDGKDAPHNGTADFNPHADVGVLHNMDGRGEGETEEEWLERLTRASDARVAALNAMKRRLDERRRVEAQMDGSDEQRRVRS